MQRVIFYPAWQDEKFPALSDRARQALQLRGAVTTDWYSLPAIPRAVTSRMWRSSGSQPATNSLTVRATREQAYNKLLYAALFKLDTPGNWRLNGTVSHNSDAARFDCLLPVTTASPKLSGLWPCLAFPPIAIALFALNQKLRRDSLEKPA